MAGDNSNAGSAWSSSWFLVACKEIQFDTCRNSQACPNVSAPNFEDHGTRSLETFPIGGVNGQHYKVTFTFNAIAEGKYYENGTRDQGDTVGANPDGVVHDTFYRDGNPIPSNYIVWKLAVLDEEGQAARHYFMNSFPPASGLEHHKTYAISYSKAIVVIGGGSVVQSVQDSNCATMNNCGQGVNSMNSCAAPRDIPNEPHDVQLPAMYQDGDDGLIKPIAELNIVTGAAQPWHSNIGHLTITAIEATDEPVTHDF